ncbi:hypothetical protein [Kribbella sp. VKM Ac-2566]|uniref:hypothetical protein n=1 Tax=Kribbella sp. VKM Ac-2566 TaxID=2512218 RepID=UPI00106456E8|nr:hypothetical protein [Kribbella sp. VKM Ac-2566]TDX08397.1 hypothetical protein EV647_0318 [Kribbella sp. VKM Ac-2566]
MTLEQARDLLRDELLAAAWAVAPGVVTQDSGPINPGAPFGERGPSVCIVTVETTDPSQRRTGAELVTAAGRVLAERGWYVGQAENETGHHRIAVTRNGFDVAIHAWDNDWKLTLTGQTPLPEDA